MKKLIFTFIMVIAMIFAINTETKAQTSFGVNAGYSWLTGMVGPELEVGHWSVGMGYMPTSMPGSGDPITSISWFVTYQDAVFKESSGYYVAFGQAMNGYRAQTSYNGGAYGSDVTASMLIGMIGYKYNWYSGLNLKGGVGYGWCEYAGVFAWEVTLGYKFGL